MANNAKDSLLMLSDEILRFLLQFKKENPDFTFSLRKRDSVQSDEKRLEIGQWFQGSNYIYVPLFKKGDSARKVKTIGFEISFNEDGSIKNNFIEVSFKGGINLEEEISFHKSLVKELGIELGIYKNGTKFYDNPANYLDNLKDYVTRVRSLALRGLEEYKLKEKYVITETEFQKDLAVIQNIRKKLHSNESQENKIEAIMNANNNYDTNPLNQILFGPPGTGKTYNTINKALTIIGENIENKTRKEIKELFDARVEEGKIVFTTFHQSMGYEDFIEGIKPQYNETKGILEYPVMAGIFKEVCYNALKETYYSNIEQKEDNEISFDFLFNDFLKELQKNYKDNDFPFTTKEGSELRLDKTELDANKIIVYYRWSNNSTKTGEGKTPFPIKKEKLQKMFELGVSDKESNLNERLKPILSYHLSPHYAVYKSFLLFAKNKLPTSAALSEIETETLQEGFDYAKFLEQLLIIQKQKEKLTLGKPFVLIIDEINRGNISQIFGELITLLEEDKRLGSKEMLTLKLPYSKTDFAVPNNVYIIGTMNTADRSVEALDAALRRRFCFEEMQPKPKLLTPMETLRRFWLNSINQYGGSVESYDSYEKEIRHLLGIEILDSEKYIKYGDSENNTLSKDEFETSLNELVSFKGIDLSELLVTINNRIEKLLDKDHHIGHSYFLSVFSVQDLIIVFHYKIIPLLQEYFFGDFGKIGLVLGRGFVCKKEWGKLGDAFADFDIESASDYEDKDVYEIIDYTKQGLDYTIPSKIDTKAKVPMDFEKAIQLLMRKEIE